MSKFAKVTRSCLLFTLLFFLGILAAIFFTSPGRTVRDIIYGYLKPARTVKPETCIANLKLVGQAMAQYLSSNDAYPPANRWMDELSNYFPLGNDVTKQNRDQFLRCPAVKDGDGYGYGMNDKLSSKSAASAIEKATTTLVFDTASLIRNAHAQFNLQVMPTPPRHPNGSNLLFLDGSVRSFPAK